MSVDTKWDKKFGINKKLKKTMPFKKTSYFQEKVLNNLFLKSSKKKNQNNFVIWILVC